MKTLPILFNSDPKRIIGNILENKILRSVFISNKIEYRLEPILNYKNMEEEIIGYNLVPVILKKDKENK